MKKSILILLLLSLSGCATMFSDKTQQINLKVVDHENELIENPSCVITDPHGESTASTDNPAIVNISRGNGDLRINCRKAGFTQDSTAAGSNFNSTSLVNLLFWPGFVVDAATGAYKKYPSHFIVTMKKEKTK